MGRQDPGSDPERIVGFNSSVGILSVGTEGAVDAQGRVKSFNSSVGILSVGTSVAGQIVVIVNEVSIPQSEFCPLGPNRPLATSPSTIVSIPQSEFCPLGHQRSADRAANRRGFNSSVGILSVGTRPGARLQPLRRSFNSSVGILSVGTKPAKPNILNIVSFNSSVGILSVGTSIKSIIEVIPLCFNSSVGILSVGTPGEQRIAVLVHQFQFLSRNSVRWDPSGQGSSIQASVSFQFLSRNSVRWDTAARQPLAPVEFVSIPQSEFCPLGRRDGRGDHGGGQRVSIPQSEFCPLGRNAKNCGGIGDCSFNSSVGILSVGTIRYPRNVYTSAASFNSSVGILSVGTVGAGDDYSSLGEFQFLSRNSVRWDLRIGIEGGVPELVSIPQSEFCPLGLEERKAAATGLAAFQFLSRNSVRWDRVAR